MFGVGTLVAFGGHDHPMDAGISGALASVRSDLRRIESTFGARLHQVEGRIDAGDAALRGEVRELQATVAAMADALRGDLHLVAVRLAALEATIAGIRAVNRPPEYEESTYDLPVD
jgi:hypothetical protein